MKKVAITCGDPAGVGPEILLAWARARASQAPSAVLVGPRFWLERMKAFGDFETEEVGGPSFSIRPGEPTLEGAGVARDCLEQVAEGCRAGRYRAVVTGPVSKEWLGKTGFSYPGQTEFFAARWGGEPVMAFCGRRLRVALATWHLPLADVARELNPRRLERAVRAVVRLAGLCGIHEPRVAVCGLNPHAGESGLLGEEEEGWIDPVLTELRREFPRLSPAIPGDTVFWRALQGEFDAIVALYHDQGLGPLKTVEFEEAVNVTLGLPWLRTSPDHGTGYGIAGSGRARGGSFSRAIELAARFGEEVASRS